MGILARKPLSRSDSVFKKLRLQITGVSVALVLVVLTVVFAGMGLSEYNAKMDFVYKQLEQSISDVTKGTSYKAETVDDSKTSLVPFNQNRISRMFPMVSNAGEAFHVASTQTSENEAAVARNVMLGGSAIAPTIGANAVYQEAYVPIIIYRIDDITHSLEPVYTQMAQLTEESIEEANQTLVSAPYGFSKDKSSTLCYLKKRTSVGDIIAFTDITTVNYYVQTMVQAFLIVVVVVLLALGTVAWFASGWIVQPAQEAWRRQRRFIADASHELKTPISVIVANSSIILDSPETDVESRKWTKTTLNEAQNMKSLVEDMLYLAANDAQKQSNFEEVNFSKEVMKAAMQFEARAFEKNNSLEYSDVEKDVLVDGDVAGIRRLLGILLDNACKYSHENTPIEISLSTDHKHAVLKVSDEGENIPEGMEEEVFGRFVRTDSSRTRVSGYGLGLAMAKDIVEQHGGVIEAKTLEEGITEFKVALPLNAKQKRA